MNQTLCTVVIHIFFLLYTTYGDICDPDTKPKTDSQRVKEMLLCTLDKKIRPGLYSTNSTLINVVIFPITIDYDEFNARLNMKTLIQFVWKDETIKWDEDKYNQMYTYIDSDQVWIPDLMLLNWKEEPVHIDQMDSPIWIMNSGHMGARVMPVLSGHCAPDTSKWPFDSQTCDFTLTSEQYYGNEIDFKILNQFVPKWLEMKEFIPNRVWEMVDFRVERIVAKRFQKSNSFRVDIKIYLNIKRHASVLVSSYVMPGFVMMLLSLTLLWFNPSTSQKIPLICVLFLLQSMFMKFLTYKIPSNRSNIPGIVIFYCGSLVITLYLMLLTILTRLMVSWVSRPLWLTTILNFSRTNKILQMILITEGKIDFEFAGDENEKIAIKETTNQGNKEWFEFAVALNRVTFVILFPIYFILFLHFIV